MRMILLFEINTVLEQDFSPESQNTSVFGENGEKSGLWDFSRLERLFKQCM